MPARVVGRVADDVGTIAAEQWQNRRIAVADRALVVDYQHALAQHRDERSIALYARGEHVEGADILGDVDAEGEDQVGRTMAPGALEHPGARQGSERVVDPLGESPLLGETAGANGDDRGLVEEELRGGNAERFDDPACSNAIGGPTGVGEEELAALVAKNTDRKRQAIEKRAESGRGRGALGRLVPAAPRPGLPAHLGHRATRLEPLGRRALPGSG